MGPTYRDLSERYLLQSCADQNENERNVCEQHLEKISRQVFPVRQVECNNSSQYKINHKI